MAQDPAAMWATFSPVERTCLQTCLFRWKAGQLMRHPDGNALYSDGPAERIIKAVLPPDAEQQMVSSSIAPYMLNMMGVRTAAIDKLLMEAAEELDDPGLQVVLLGAGMDTRAWRLDLQARRLQWFEVDTATVHGLKQQLLGGLSPVHRRRGVVADITDGAQLEQGLAAAGFLASAPSVWVMEGFIGYISAEQQQQLAAQLHHLSAPRSRVIATSPPDEASRQELLQLGVQLHHTNFDPAAEVAARFASAGWSQVEIIDRRRLLEEYNIQQHLDLLVMGR